MSSSIKRSQQFMYFQSKAKHYDNIRKIQPAIHSFRQQHQSPRPRPRSLLKQYDQQRTNQYLVNTILSIQHKTKSRIQVLGNYSRYNNFNQNSHKISKYGTFRQAQRYRSIQHQNFTLGLKILEMKPSIGTVTDWNQEFVNVKSRKKIASKLDQKKSMSIYARNQFVPDYYRTFMDRDGSTVAIKDKLFQVPKFIAETYLDPKKSNKKQIKLDLDFQQIIKDTSGQLNNNIH